MMYDIAFRKMLMFM